MHLLHSLDNLPTSAQGSVLCIGNFDGVHVGHAAMLSTARDLAAASSRPFVIMTFDPHPATLLRPDAPLRPLTTLAQRLDLLAAFHPHAIIVIPTTRDFLAIPPEDFLRSVVHDTLAATHIVEGNNFRFGRGAKGNTQTLHQLGPALGFQTTIIPTATRTLSDFTQVNVSSSLCRWLVEHGRMRDAALCLNHPFAIRGTVVRGAQRGRTIGYPTANILSAQITPAPGVYAGFATVNNTLHRAAISVGNNPTFNAAATTIEAFLLDFSGDLYGTTLDVAFTHYVRDMLKFASVESLTRQMAHDIAHIRTLPLPS